VSKAGDHGQTGGQRAGIISARNTAQPSAAHPANAAAFTRGFRAAVKALEKRAATITMR